MAKMLTAALKSLFPSLKASVTKGILAFLFGGIFLYFTQAPESIVAVWRVIVWLIIGDVATGSAVAIARGTFKSTIFAKKGAKRLLGYAITFGLAVAIDTLLKSPYILATWASYYIAVGEIASVTENLGKLGIPLPAGLQKIIANMRKRVEQVEAKGWELDEDEIEEEE